MGRDVNHGPECHGVCHLPVEPDIFIGREQPRELGSNNTDDVTKHWNEDKTTIIRENETSPTRCPDRELETIQNVEFLVCLLMEM